MKSVPATEVEMTLTPAKALERAISKDQLLASKATLRELIEKLLSPKFDRYVARERRDTLLILLWLC